MAVIPEKALDALLAAPAEAAGFTVRPITLGMAAVLQKVRSPLSTGDPPGGLGDWIPTLYAMTRDAAESRRILASGGEEAYRRAAEEWADGLSVADGLALVRACSRAAATATGVNPEGDGGEDADPTSRTTAG